MSSPTGVPAKVCVQCGQDCSNKPRTKDPQGRYTCKACFDTLAANARDKSVSAKAAVPTPELLPAAEPTDDVIMASLLKDSAPATLTETCPSCGSGLVAGSVVCTICGYNKQTGRTASAKDLEPAAGPDCAGGSVALRLATAPLVLLLAAVGASIAGLVGAVVWAAVAYGTGYEIGWIAWGVGAATGFGAFLFSGRRANPLTGLIAVVVALLSIAGGKYAATSAAIDGAIKRDKKLAEVMHHRVTDEEIVRFVARDIAKEHASKGVADEWPDDADRDRAVDDTHLPPEEDAFPKTVINDARDQCAKMSSAEKDQWLDRAQSIYNTLIAAATDRAKSTGFLDSFTPHDILWGLLAVVTAFSVGSGARAAGAAGTRGKRA